MRSESKSIVHEDTGGSIRLPPAGPTVVPSLSEGERRLAAEVEDLNSIHALSLRLAATGALADVLLDVLRTAVGLVGARLGSVQLVTPAGELAMVGQVGFGDSILDRFAIIRLDDCSTCAVAMQRKARVVARDLRTDPDFAEGAALRSYGAAAAVSTPILDRGGNVHAMLSVYWLEEHEPSARELRALDLCAELAGRHVERSAAQARQTLLMRELMHRGKNLVSVIQAIASRSLRGDITLDAAREVFIGRLQALAHTYNTLTEDAPECAQLHDIVAAGLTSLGDRADVGGPAVLVSAKNAQTLSLVIHELANHAAKYGALSVPSGRIKVAWEIASAGSDDERFRFTWRESGGPPVCPPARTGFGSVIVTVVVGKDLNCAPTMDFAEDGFLYRLECSAAALTGVTA